VELALLQLRELESEGRGASGAPEAQVQYSLELQDASGQTIFRLEEVGQAEGKVRVRCVSDNQAPRESLMAPKAYEQWQQDMQQLTTPPPNQEGKQEGGK